ncbi:FAD-dependent oxidoreductase [Candidatus Poribacteria bacterium]|nr:FAD-dependent oxidoreductase [Candidatus Poribacteria bacterium]
MINTEIVIVGAGPAGLCAAIEACRYGSEVILIDENQSPGGQLFKQIHKFFGSQDHNAGIRGFRIGQKLLEECHELHIQVMLNTTVWGIFEGNQLAAINSDKSFLINPDKIILTTGASENSFAFPGWTLPGVMGAGAVQTMMNIHRVLPGKNVLMVGSGNVGLIVAYQLLQAGAKLKAVIEASSNIGGYMVHGAKLLRAGVPILTSHTIIRASGNDEVEKAIVSALDDKWKPLPGSEKEFDVDLICIAVGLSPQINLCKMAGCKFKYVKELGGHIPVYNREMETTIPGLYIAGDLSGIAEASTAMEEGKLAGLSAAKSLGYISEPEFRKQSVTIYKRLENLRM